MLLILCHLFPHRHDFRSFEPVGGQGTDTFLELSKPEALFFPERAEKLEGGLEISERALHRVAQLYQNLALPVERGKSVMPIILG
jgi:hypothetical protein